MREQRLSIPPPVRLFSRMDAHLPRDGHKYQALDELRQYLKDTPMVARGILPASSNQRSLSRSFPGKADWTGQPICVGGAGLLRELTDVR